MIELKAKPGCCEEAALGIPFYAPCNQHAVNIVGWKGRSDSPIRMCAACTDHNIRNRSGEIVERLADVVINPGTEGRADAMLANAEIIAGKICEQFGLPASAVIRVPQRDRDGFFGFMLTPPWQLPIELDIPGDEPEQFLRSQPFVSRRMYVDGSSWLYGFAISAIERRIRGERGWRDE